MTTGRRFTLMYTRALHKVLLRTVFNAQEEDMLHKALTQEVLIFIKSHLNSLPPKGNGEQTSEYNT